jgi:hypothetical protein
LVRLEEGIDEIDWYETTEVKPIVENQNEIVVVGCRRLILVVSAAASAGQSNPYMSGQTPCSNSGFGFDTTQFSEETMTAFGFVSFLSFRRSSSV